MVNPSNLSGQLPENTTCKSVTELPDFPVKFSWEPLYTDLKPEGYRVVIILPSIGKIHVEAPEMTTPADITFHNGMSTWRGAIRDKFESELPDPRSVHR
jgi:hypothetical protein